MAAVRAVKRLLRSTYGSVRQPLWTPPGHYYSPVPGPADTERALGWRARAADVDELPGIDLRATEQRALLHELAPSFVDVPKAAREGWRYRPDNTMYGLADAAIYHAMLRMIKPRKVVEVGSGFSSAIALDTADRFGIGEPGFTFVEPYPDRLYGLLTEQDRARCTVHVSPVQDVDPDVLTDLDEGDILFIDSTHVLKAGSDVAWLLFEILPRLRKGVYVHIHDVFWPFEYPEAWLREGRGWNEDYLLRAYLQHNTEFEITLFGSWVWLREAKLVGQALPEAVEQLPGSIWLRRASAA